MTLHTETETEEEPMTQALETIAKLNELLEAERAGVDAMARLAEAVSTPEMQKLFAQVKSDEAWSCAGLADAIRRLGGTMSEKKGDFAEKVMSMPTLPERLRLLNRGQGWVVKRLDVLLQQSDIDLETRSFLTEMRTVHARNIAGCDDLVCRLGT